MTSFIESDSTVATWFSICSFDARTGIRSMLKKSSVSTSTTSDVSAIPSVRIETSSESAGSVSSSKTILAARAADGVGSSSCHSHPSLSAFSSPVSSSNTPTDFSIPWIARNNASSIWSESGAR